jgi:methylmalonyl-CoA/ethylmalonyl-CoA epimerase
VGIACRDIDDVRAWVHDTFAVTRDSGVVHDPLQDADLCLLHIDGELAFELVSGRIVEGMLHRRTSYYHLCYEADRIEDAIAHFEARRCRLVSGPVPAVLFDGRPVAFLLSPIGLVEVLGSS